MPVNQENAFIFPLTRNGYRHWMLNLHNPVVVIVSTPLAQEDLRHASCFQGVSTLFNRHDSAQKDITHQTTMSALTFSNVFQPFGSLPASLVGCSSLSKENFTQTGLSCPTNVTIRIGDKRRTADYFPVHFVESTSCEVPSIIEADKSLLQAVNDNSPNLESLKLRHKLHEFSHRRFQSKINQSNRTDKNEEFISDNSTRIPSQNTRKDSANDEVNETINEVSKLGHLNNPKSASPVSIEYPHSEIRLTHTYCKGGKRLGNLNLLYSQDTDTFLNESTLYDALFLRHPIDSCVLSKAESIPYIWWESWILQLCRSLDFSDHESLCLPVSFIFIASSRDPEPVSAFESLAENLSPFFRQQAPDVNGARSYILIDVINKSQSDLNKFTNEGIRCTNEKQNDSLSFKSFANIQNAFPPSSCHLLQLNKLLLDYPLNGIPISESDILIKFILLNYTSLQTIAHNVILQAVIPTLERLVKRIGEQLAQHRKGLRNQLRNFWNRRPRTAISGNSGTVPGILNDTGLDHAADIIWGSFVGSDDSIASSTKKDNKLSQEKKNVDFPQVTTIELLGRLYGDLYFFLGDYNQAAAAYRISVAEFKHLKATKQLAGVLEMLGISLFLSGGSRSEIESSFNQSLTFYFECGQTRLALRSQIAAARALLSLDPVLFANDVAEKFDRLSWEISARETSPLISSECSEDEASQQRQIWTRAGSIRAGLLLEQTALCYSLAKQKFKRKMLFYFVLAGHTFNKTGFKHHALRCYSIVLRDLGDCRWKYISDHLLFAVARQSFTVGLLGDSLFFFLHLLNNLIIHSLSLESSHYIRHNRSTALSGLRTEPFYLPLDVQSVASFRFLAKKDTTTTPSREATYLKEALFVFKAWVNHIETRLNKSPQSYELLSAFSALRFDLELPIIDDETNITLIIEGDEQHDEPDHLNTSLTNLSEQFLSNFSQELPPLGQLIHHLGITLTSNDRQELLYLRRNFQRQYALKIGDDKQLNDMCQEKQSMNDCVGFQDEPSLNYLRSTSFGTTIILEFTFRNPLQVPLECHNLRAYGHFIPKNSDEITLHNDPLSLYEESPFILNEQCSAIEFSCQLIKLEPKQVKRIRCNIVPKESGVLYIKGLCWDLYNIIKIYKPISIIGKKRLSKDIINDAMFKKNMFQFGSPYILPGTLLESNPIYSLISGTPIELPLMDQYAPPEVLLKQALLISHLTSDHIIRTRQTIEHHPTQRLNLIISQTLPRISWELLEWPISGVLFHGQRHHCIMKIMNSGHTTISSITLAVSRKDVCFLTYPKLHTTQNQQEFFDQKSTYHIIYSTPLSSGECLYIPIILRGSTTGFIPLHFCILSEYIPPVCHQDNHITVSSLPNDNNLYSKKTELKTNPIHRIRKWTFIYKLLHIIPSLHTYITHHASWRYPGSYVTICQFEQHIYKHYPLFSHIISLSDPTFKLTDSTDLSKQLQCVILNIEGFIPSILPTTSSTDTVSFPTPVTLSPIVSEKEMTFQTIPSDIPIQSFYTCILPQTTGKYSYSKNNLTPNDDHRPSLLQQRDLLKIYSVIQADTLQQQDYIEIKNRLLAQSAMVYDDQQQILPLHILCRRKQYATTAHSQSIKRIHQTQSKHHICLDFIIHWALQFNGKTIINGEQLIYQVPLFSVAASCPLKFQIHPSARIIQKENSQLQTNSFPFFSHLKNNFMIIENIQLTLQSTSPTASISVTIEADTEASSRNLAIQQSIIQSTNGTHTGIRGGIQLTQDPSRLHRQWVVYNKQVNTHYHDTSSTLYGVAVNRFPASGVVWLGKTRFTLKKLEPGQIISSSLSLLIPRPGIYNLNKFRFIVHSLDDKGKKDGSNEKIFAFPFECLIYYDGSSCHLAM